MGRGPLFEADFRPQFSGHETFPIRYGWLKKVHDAIARRAEDPLNRSVFVADEAIANFGVGKNMVASMRYWALATHVIEDTSKGHSKGPYSVTPLGQALFADEGWDPYLEEPASLWWLHWQIAANPRPTTTIYFVFNHLNATTFYREQLTAEIRKYCAEVGYKELADFTLKRDTDCFVRTYISRGGDSEEEALESQMSELGLLQPIGKRDGFLLSRGPKPSLPNEVFLYGLVQFAIGRPNSSSLNVETLAHEPGSPGRVFLLDEESLLERLAAIEDLSHGQLTWSETAGLRQIFFKVDPQTINMKSLLGGAYRKRRRLAA
jgi:hypothetical protein